MASAFVPSFELASSTSLRMLMSFQGADVAGGSQVHPVTVTGIDFANDNAATIQAKIGTAIRAATAVLANSSGGAGYTVPANQITLPGFSKA